MRVSVAKARLSLSASGGCELQLAQPTRPPSHLYRDERDRGGLERDDDLPPYLSLEKYRAEVSEGREERGKLSSVLKIITKY